MCRASGGCAPSKWRGPSISPSILAAIAGPLGEAEIPIFALSTFETDYILVPARRFDEAAQLLSERFELSP